MGNIVENMCFCSRQMVFKGTCGGSTICCFLPATIWWRHYVQHIHVTLGTHSNCKSQAAKDWPDGHYCNSEATLVFQNFKCLHE